MKKFISIVVVIILILSTTVALVGCGDKTTKGSTQYVVFYDDMDNEYKVDYEGGGRISSSKRITLPYTDQEIRFRYEIFDEDGKHLTGGDFPAQKFGSEEYGKTKQSTLTATTHFENETKRFHLVITMEAKPDNRIMPDYRLDPNGATEYEENVRYVYEYDGSLEGKIEAKQFLELFAPSFSVYLNNNKVEIDKLVYGVTYGLYNSEGEGSRFIDTKKLVGTYKLIYNFSAEEIFGYEDAFLEYYNVRIELQIEIVSSIS